MKSTNNPYNQTLLDYVKHLNARKTELELDLVASLNDVRNLQQEIKELKQQLKEREEKLHATQLKRQ